jgi:hypothetical protein
MTQHLRLTEMNCVELTNFVEVGGIYPHTPELFELRPVFWCRPGEFEQAEWVICVPRT